MYSRILVPIDGSSAADRGLQEAVALAAETKAQLVLLNVVDDYPILTEIASAGEYAQLRRHLMMRGEALLEKAHRQASQAGVDCEIVLRESRARVFDTIVDEATRRKCKLIVMGTHGRRGFDRLTMGSDAEMVVRESTVPVLLVRLQTSGS